ncbi:heparin/heparin-sulfate lyase HepB [Rugamonas rubra]|nr:heparin/heparin-sulfate lyase HepB [Rugamonas rubra]
MNSRTVRAAMPAFASLVVLLASPSTQAGTQTVSFTTEKIFEAEHGDIANRWETQTDATEPNTRYVVVPTGPVPSVPDAVAELSYTVQADVAANYVLWMRVLAPNSYSDSLYWTNDERNNSIFWFNDSYNKWVWVMVSKSLPLSAGPHTLKVKYHNAGMRIDRILLTKRGYFKPTGIGEDPTVYNSMPPSSYNVALPQPPLNEHPRLLLRAGDLQDIRNREAEAALRANDRSPEYQAMNAAWGRLRAFAKNNPSGTLPPPPKPGDPADAKKELAKYCGLAAETVRAKALLHLIDSDEQSGRHAISLMEGYFDTCKIDNTRAIGETIWLSAIVYDWCYWLMNTDQRTAYIERFVALASKMEIGFPPVNQSAVTGHSSEAQLLRDQLSAGIAFYDETTAVYQLAAGRILQEFIAPRELVYKSHSHHQGDSYGPYRYTWDVYAAWIFQRMGAGNVFPSTQQYTPYQWLYTRRPDGQLMRDGDSYQGGYNAFNTYWNQIGTYMLTASYYDEPYLKDEFVRQLALAAQSPTPDARHPYDDLSMVVLNKPQLANTDTKTLPLSRYFAEPAGQMVARTGWSEGVQMQSPAVVATMKVGGYYFANHQHLDAGHFQLYYKGNLAIDSGLYEGVLGTTSQSYGSAHDSNYHKRTVAHNAMLVYKDGEKFINTASNDGGQRFVLAEPATLTALKDDKNGYRVANVLKHEIGPDNSTPDYSYLKGDIAPAYSDKISNYTRSFVFLNLKNNAHPAALLVLDKVKSSNKDFKKTWLLHSVQEPALDSQTATIKRDTDGYNGKLINRTLLPLEATLTKVGGKDQEYSVYDGSTGRYVNYPISLMDHKGLKFSEEPGAWRVEVSPKEAAEADVFFNVMQVMDADSALPPLATDAVVSASMHGVKIDNRVVLFAKDDADLSGTASFELATADTLRVLVTDLSQGYWSVSRNGAPATVEYEVGAEDGTMYFVAAGAGSYTLRQASKRTLPAPPVLTSLPLPAPK